MRAAKEKCGALCVSPCSGDLTKGGGIPQITGSMMHGNKGLPELVVWCGTLRPEPVDGRAKLGSWNS